MRVLVCGGRHYNDRTKLERFIRNFNSNCPITEIIHGGATGADTLAGEIAQDMGIPVRVFKANWRKYGRSAGPIRNKQMLRDGKPDAVFACPGGIGTEGMCAEAYSKGIAVYSILGDNE